MRSYLQYISIYCPTTLHNNIHNSNYHYQIETEPVPIIDQNTKADSYCHLQIDRPYITLNSETYISLRQQELAMCKKIGYEFYCKELFEVEK